MKQSFSSLLRLVSSPRCRRTLVAGLLATVVALGVVSYAPLAHAASRSSAQAKVCTLVVASLRPGGSSDVRSNTCVTTAGDIVSDPFVITPDTACSGTYNTLIMTWWVNANYGGTVAHVCSRIGGCALTPIPVSFNINYVGNAMNDAISSFKFWNNCDEAIAYVNADLKGASQDYVGNTSYVGSRMNDQISSFHIDETPIA